MTDHVVALFASTEDASNAVEKLAAAGVVQERMSLIMGESYRGKHFGIEDTTKMPEGAATGGAIGVVLGALAGGLALAGSIVVPGSGILISGPITGGLAGAGGAAGGVAGALAGVGVTEQEAKIYEDAIANDGGMLLGEEVTDSDEDTVKAILRDAGGEGLYET